MMSFAEALDEHAGALRSIDAVSVEAMATDLVITLHRGSKVLVCGNGGSAADAQHFAAELVVRFETDRRALPAIAITTDSSAITAAANDLGYESVFSRMVEALGAPRDALLCLSTSGRSGNILRAQDAARRAGMRIWAITGPLPNAAAAAAGHVVSVDGSTARVQEGTALVLHYLASVVDAVF